LTPSEVAFLALGLVLGVASGAALIEVLRARPAAAREVRVTVAPNAIHARFAATLADPTAAATPSGPASFGPGDRRIHDEIATDDGGPVGRRAADRDEMPTARGPLDPVPAAPIAGTPVPIRIATRNGELVAVPIELEPDPMTAALQTAAVVATAAGAQAGARPGPPTGAASGPSRRGATSPSDGSAADGAGGGSVPAAAGPQTVDATGPCADARRVAEERCAVAARARQGAEAAAETLRAAQRSYDEHVAVADTATAAADPRAMRAAKEAAQQRFRDARTAARSRDDVEAAARNWLAEINQINQDTREAAAKAERSRAAATALAMTLERLSVESDAARISAEQADEACVAAREVVAACDEAQALEAATERAAAARAAAAVAEPPAPQRPAAVSIGAATPIPEEEFGLATPMGSRAGQDAILLRILRGDREAMQHAVSKLAGAEADGGKRWQSRLSGLAEALVARSIEASAFDFPLDHFFWGPFNQEQNRDIAAALASMGYRFDGFGGWVDDRIPGQRDLSLALGYAGLDPMRIRHWPNEAEMRDLFAEVRVAADEYVAAAAGGLTLGELVTLLGRRADGLTDLWNDWGTVRPVLLEGG